jgi:methionyl aminopeptidase
MISIKNKLSIEKMHTAGKLLASILEQVIEILKPGISTLEIDAWVAKKLQQNGLVSTMKGYRGYKNVTCISINDVVVHGIPTAENKLKDGDLVKIDVCASYNGYCADMARCYFIGTASTSAKKLVEAAKIALDKGIEQARVGNHLSDISAAIQHEVESHGFGVVRAFAGHGIGKSMHEDPEILNYGKPGKGPILRAGMTFALEPMITMGNFDVYIDKDGWTVKTKDKSLAAHVEDTVAVTDSGPRVLTRL